MTREHSSKVSSGMQKARAIRERWTASLLTNEVTFKLLVEASKSEGDDRHLENLKLYDLLKARKGWTEVTAFDALSRNGFGAKDTVKSIRRSPSKIDQFSMLLASTADRWRARPAPPKGWPWAGKLAVLVESSGEPLPQELVDEGSEDEAALLSLLSDDADESEEVEDKSNLELLSLLEED